MKKIFLMQLVCGSLIFSTIIKAEAPDVALSNLNKHRQHILYAAKIFDVSPQYLASIIYTERLLNYDWKDELLDLAYVSTGQNGSIGFSQIKIKTAYFIETQYSDTLSDFFPGKKFNGLLNRTLSVLELITKLQNDSTNIFYAAAYLRIMQSYWNKASFSIDEKPEILGTLYSYGLFDKQGKPLTPHAKPQANAFGNVVKKSLLLFKDW